MKTRMLLSTLALLLSPLWATAQHLESGTTKTASFNNTKTEVTYLVTPEQDGQLTFTVQPLGSVRIERIALYGAGNDTDTYIAEGSQTLTVSDVAVGTYRVRISGRATDQDGRGGTFSVSYVHTPCALANDPEPNDSRDMASLLVSATPQEGHLGYKNAQRETDVADWYKIEVPEDGKLTFTTRSSTTLRLGRLSVFTPTADGTDISLRTEKDMDAYEKDTTLVLEVPNASAGTYYVRLAHYRGYGGYTLGYFFTGHSQEADPEPNDTWQQAMTLTSGPAVSGQLGYAYGGQTDVTDWYVIDVPKEGAAVFSTTAETTLRLGRLTVYRLDDEASDVVYRTEKDMDDYDKDTTVVFTVPDMAPGRYLVRLGHYRGYGTYNLQYVFNPNVHQNDPEPNDTWQQASLIDNEATQEGCLGYAYATTDVTDWYKIEVPDEGQVVFSTTSETSLRLYRLTVHTLNDDASDVVYRTEKDMDAYGRDTTVVFTLTDVAPGTYYLRLGHYRGYGGYRLHYSFTPNVHGADAADNDTWDKATTIESGSTQHGRLGYSYATTDDTDWFKIEVPYDGDATFSATSDTSLRLYRLTVYTPNADGTDLTYYSEKDMDGYEKDTTVVFNLAGLARGTYYLRQNRYRGNGGYALKYEFERNPYDRGALDNGTFASRLALDEGQTVTTTLGYRYRSHNNEDWYDLGTMHGRQIDVTVSPDTTRSLVVGICRLYIYNGDNDDGTPRLQTVAEQRLERSQGTISHVDRNADDSHYVFCVPAYGGSHGGYAITFGREASDEGRVEMANAHVSVMTEGRNTVRKGVPCENPITITNASGTRTGRFLLTIGATDDVDIIGFRMNGKNGQHYLPIDSVTVTDGSDCEHTAVFYVPGLDPWESYTFTMISEGKGDIAYSRTTDQLACGDSRIVVSGTTFAVVAVMGFVADAVVSDKIDDYINDHVAAVFELDDTERQQYARCMGLTVEQLGIEKQQTGMAAYTVKSVVKKALTSAIEMVPGGKIVTKAGGLLETMQSIVPSIRRRLWMWIYKDLGYVKDDVDVIDGKAAITDVVASWDPNEMVGPQGVGDSHYIAETQTVNYRILFENKAEAGDAAYRVRISDELDESVFDPSTVRFGETSHDGVGYNWEMTREGNRLSWDIKGIELPPNVNAPEGEGYVSFSVDLRPGLPDGTQLRNKAIIIFDKNLPIETNEFVNTLDLTPPTTVMGDVAYDDATGVLTIGCTSADKGSGVDSHLLFVSTDGSPYEYAGQFAPGSVAYAPDGSVTHDYMFYVLTIDNVGNVEQSAPRAIGVHSGIDSATRDGSRATRGTTYAIDGRRVGTSPSGLKKGVYVRDGRKFVVK